MARSSLQTLCVTGWTMSRGETLSIEPGSLWENGYAENFHSRFRDEFVALNLRQRPRRPGPHGHMERRLQHPAAPQLAGLPDPGRVRRRVYGFHLGQGLGSSRTRWIPRPDLFLNPPIAWFRKPKPVNRIHGDDDPRQADMHWNDSP